MRRSLAIKLLKARECTNDTRRGTGGYPLTAYTEVPQLSKSAKTKYSNTILIRLKRTCNTQRLMPSRRYQAPTLAGSSLIMDQRKLRPCGSAYLGLNQFTLPKVYHLSSFEAGRGLKACHAFPEVVRYGDKQGDHERLNNGNMKECEYPRHGKRNSAFSNSAFIFYLMVALIC